MIKSCSDVATSLGTILTPRPTPSVLSAALLNNKNILFSMSWLKTCFGTKNDHKWPITFVMKNWNVHGIHMKLNSMHVLNFHDECYRPFVVDFCAKASY